MSMHRFAGGKISLEIAFYDTAKLMRDLGVTVLPHAAAAPK
jgi:hypothetical protein